MTTTKERPILFNGPMVRALLDGGKTQTRRIVKPQADARTTEVFQGADGIWRFSYPTARAPVSHADWDVRCPYGVPGDQLWVRESWQYNNWTEDGYPWIGYKANGETRLCNRIPDCEWADRLTEVWERLSSQENYSIDGLAADRKWRPSIHMPHWASRLMLEIACVRVERLQDISEADAVAEGLETMAQHNPIGTPTGKTLALNPWIPNESPVWDTPIGAYRSLWESINGTDSWVLNPWVFVVEFKAIKQ